MAFDGITLHHIVRELTPALLHGKINKVYMPSKNEILLGIYARTGKIFVFYSILTLPLLACT